MPIQKILVAEPDGATRTAMAAALQQGGAWTVTTAADAAETQRLVEDRPDLLLLDAGLLAVLGSDFPARVHASRPTSRLVVVLTGDTVAVPESAGVLRKPFDAPTLAAQVQAFFETARLEQQLGFLQEVGGLDFVGEMIDLFLEHAPTRLADARAGADTADWSAVARAVHPLKSSAGNLGADAVQGLAERIEARATAGDAPSVSALLPQLEAAYEQIKGRLWTIREKRP